MVPTCPLISTAFPLFSFPRHVLFMFHEFPMHVLFVSPSCPFHLRVPFISFHLRLIALHCSSLPFHSPFMSLFISPSLLSVSLHVPFISLHSLEGRRPEPAKSRRKRACDPCFSLPDNYFKWNVIKLPHGTSPPAPPKSYVSGMSQGGD